MNEQDELIESPAALQQRRGLLLAAVAAAAGITGAAVAWYHSGHPDEPMPAQAGFWDLELPTPNGGLLAMASFRGKPLLLNFWATWCPPCIEELPLLDQFFETHRANGWQVLGLAVDQQAPVLAFLARHPLRFAVALAGVEGVALSKSFGNISGALPFSVAIAADGSVLHRKIGKLTAENLTQWGGLR